MLKKLALALLLVLVIAGALVGTKVLQFRAMSEAGASMVPPPETVTATAAEPARWERRVSSTGSLSSVNGVTLRSESPGRITGITFASGTAVETGDVLVQLDTATEVAELRAAEATVALARTSLERTRELRANRSSSAAELDAADAAYEEASARAESIRTAIAKKTVRAPFSGRLGMRMVDLGAVLKEGDPITTLQTLDPIYVDFSLPQQRLSVLATGLSVRVTTDAAPGETFAGHISAISPEVDPATRSVQVQATIANQGEKLRGGMFANVEVVLPTHDTVLAIPLTAVLYAPFGNSVFVVEDAGEERPGGKVLRQRFVRLGAERGDFVDVSDGLEAGEQIVTSGVFKLRSGMPVVVDNTLAPAASLTPDPQNR